MKTLQIFVIVFLIVALISVSGGFTAHVLNNKRYSCNSGNLYDRKISVGPIARPGNNDRERWEYTGVKGR